MVMKKIAVILLALTLVGCGRESVVRRADTIENPNRFRIESGGNMVGLALVTDRETEIQYRDRHQEGRLCNDGCKGMPRRKHQRLQNTVSC